MDGSGIEGRVGAVATMRNKDGRWTAIKYNLGAEEHHMVYEAELVGIILALHLANNRRKI